MNITQMLIILAVLPTILIGTIIYKNDTVEKESVGLLSKLFLDGICLAAIVIALTDILQTLIPFLAKDLKTLSNVELFISMFFGVALIEEGCKWLAFKLVAWKNKEFNYIYDAIVYAVFISLGFATIENVIYVIDGGVWIALVRSICSVPGHAFFGIFMGYYFGLAKQAELNNNNVLKHKNQILSIMVPAILHTIFNYCLYTQNTIGLVCYVTFLVLLYINSYNKIKQLSKIELSLT